jgi:hypothetical protein
MPKNMKKEDEVIIKTETVDLNFYTVRSQDGKWLKKKPSYYHGSNGSGSWTNDISEARIYSSTRGPKSQITWWTKNYPKYGVPYLVKITSGTCAYIDQEKRVSDSIKKKLIEEAKRKVRSLIRDSEIHQAKVKYMRGDGKDPQSIKLANELKNAKQKLEKLENSK